MGACSAFQSRTRAALHFAFASAQRAQRAAEEELAERLAARARSSAYYADGGLREGFRPDGTRITEEDS